MAEIASGAPVGRLRLLLESEPFRFVIVGGINSLFGFGVFAALESTLGHRTYYLVVLVIAQVIAVLEAYVLQRYLVFRARGRWWRDLARFSAVYAASFGVNAAALPLLVEVVGVPVIPAQGVTMLAVALGTFVVHRTFTFRHSRSAAHPAGAFAATNLEPSRVGAADSPTSTGRIRP